MIKNVKIRVIKQLQCSGSSQDISMAVNSLLGWLG